MSADLLGGSREQVADEHCRYALTEIWDEDLPRLGVMGMNPSTASHLVDDPTWARWRGFANRWGFGSQVGVNPVPFRTSDPDEALELLKGFKQGRSLPYGRDAFLKNKAVITEVAGTAACWLLGWGDGGRRMDEAFPVLERAIGALQLGGRMGERRPFIVFGLTAHGAPIHVLARGKARIPDDAPVFRFHPLTRKLGERVFMPWRG